MRGWVKQRVPIINTGESIRCVVSYNWAEILVRRGPSMVVIKIATDSSQEEEVGGAPL